MKNKVENIIPQLILTGFIIQVYYRYESRFMSEGLFFPMLKTFLILERFYTFGLECVYFFQTKFGKNEVNCNANRMFTELLRDFCFLHKRFSEKFGKICQRQRQVSETLFLIKLQVDSVTGVFV